MPERIGRYQIVAELGRGGMGIVYRAVDPELDRQVAVKVIAIEGGGEATIGELEARFRREARAAAKVTHPGVVTIHDVGREGHALYLVMELVGGGSLSDRFHRGEHPSPAEALEIAACVGEALAAAHAAGLVHRDVKPANILFTEAGQVKVTDFGVARAMDEQSELTRTGIVLGSPAYMAPEQLRSSQVDGRADLFALGVVLYEALMRRKPFAADTITSLVYEILNKDPFEEGNVRGNLGDGIAGFLRWCLAKDPAERVPDGATLAAEARRLIGSGDAAVAESGMATVVGQVVNAPTMVQPAAGATTAPTRAVSSRPATAPHEGMAIDGTGGHTTGTIAAGGGRGWAIALGVCAILLLVSVVGVGFMVRPEPTAGSDAGPAERPAGVFWGQPPTVQPEAPPAVAAPVLEESQQAPVAEPTPPVTAAREDRAAATDGGSVAAAAARPVVEPAAAVTVAEPAPPPAPVFVPPPVVDTFETRRAAEFHVSPEEAELEIGGRVIGTADDWDGMGGGQEYVFPAPGTYYVKLAAKGYQTSWVKIVVHAGARRDVADVDTELEDE